MRACALVCMLHAHDACASSRIHAEVLSPFGGWLQALALTTGCVGAQPLETHPCVRQTKTAGLSILLKLRQAA